MASRIMTYIWLPMDRHPNENGWYPVSICWDSNEGIFPGSAYWDGDWPDNADPIIKWMDTRCKTKGAALKLAHDHDYEDILYGEFRRKGVKLGS